MISAHLNYDCFNSNSNTKHRLKSKLTSCISSRDDICFFRATREGEFDNTSGGNLGGVGQAYAHYFINIRQHTEICFS